MAVRSGVAAQFGVSTESSWGTYAAPTTFFPFTSEDIRRENEYIETAGLRASRLSQSSDLHTQTTHAAAGGFELDVLTKGMGKLFNQLHGNTVTPTQIASSTAYSQAHSIGLTDNYGKSLGIQVGRPDVGGTVRSFSYLGCKVAQVSFNLERGGVLTAQWSIDAKDEDTSQTLGTATYASGAQPFTFQSGSVEFDDVVLTDCVQSASIQVTIPYKDDRYCINSSAVKKEQIVNDLITVEASLNVEFASLTQHTAFVNATRRKLELICSQGDAGSSNPYKCAFTMASTVTTGEGPVVDGPDVLTQDLSIKALDNGSAAPLVIDYVSTDTAL